MSYQSGSGFQEPRIVWFDRRIPKDMERLERYIPRDNHLVLIRNTDDTVSLRLSDEMTKGGLPLRAEECCIVDPLPPFEPSEPLTADDPLPLTFPENTTAVFLDFDLSDGDRDLTDWAPEGLADGAHLRIRKADHSPGSISFTDNHGVIYRYVNRYSEFMSFVWVANPGRLYII